MWVPSNSGHFVILVVLEDVGQGQTVTCADGLWWKDNYTGKLLVGEQAENLQNSLECSSDVCINGKVS